MQRRPIGSFFRLATLMCTIGVLAVPRAARADDNKAAAIELFDRARKLTQEGKHAEACPLYAESQRLDPAIGTRFYWAECLEKTGKLASAWGLYMDVVEIAGAAKMADKAQYAKERADALKGRLTRIIIVLSEEVRAIKGLTIKRDGVDVGSTLWGTPVPVDPGERVFSVSAPGKRTWETKVLAAGEGATLTVSIPALVDEPQVQVVPTASATATPAPDTGGWGGRHTAGVVVAGLGLVGVAIGAGLGIDAIGKHNESKAACPTRLNCSQAAVDVENAAHGSALGSTIGFIAGGVALAGGAVLFLTAGSPFSGNAKKGDTALTVHAGAQGATVTVEGRF